MPRRILRVLIIGLSIASPLVSVSPLGATSATHVQAAVGVWHIVALGDSDTTGSGDSTGLGWVGRYARLLHQKRGLTVRVTNLAQDGKTSDVLLSDVQADPATRSAIQHAQIILLGIGGADLNAGDAKWQAGKCKGKACYTAVLQTFGQHFEATVQQIRRVRTPGQAVLRAITIPNAAPGAQDVIPSFLRHDAVQVGVYQSRSLRDAICGSMNRHAGRCIDVFRVFNGPSGAENAYKKGLMNKVDCCYPSAKGQQRIAQLLLGTGLAPLR